MCVLATVPLPVRTVARLQQEVSCIVNVLERSYIIDLASQDTHTHTHHP